MRGNRSTYVLNIAFMESKCLFVHVNNIQITEVGPCKTLAICHDIVYDTFCNKYSSNAVSINDLNVVFLFVFFPILIARYVEHASEIN